MVDAPGERQPPAAIAFRDKPTLYKDPTYKMIAELKAMCGSPRLAGESLSLTSFSRHGP